MIFCLSSRGKDFYFYFPSSKETLHCSCKLFPILPFQADFPFKHCAPSIEIVDLCLVPVSQWVSLSSGKLSVHRREEFLEEVGLSAWSLSPTFTSFILWHRSGLSSVSHSVPSLSYEHRWKLLEKSLPMHVACPLCQGPSVPAYSEFIKMLAHVLLPGCTTATFLPVLCQKWQNLCGPPFFHGAYLSLEFVFLITLQPQLSDRLKRMVLLDTDFVLLGYQHFFFFFPVFFMLS